MKISFSVNMSSVDCREMELEVTEDVAARIQYGNRTKKIMYKCMYYKDTCSSSS